MSDAEAIDRLRSALEAVVVDGAPLAPADAAVLLAGLRLGSVDRALGLDPRAERDRIVREAMVQFFPHLSAHARAVAFSSAWERFAAGPWLRERHLAEPPPHRIGRIESAFWRCLKIHPHTLGVERLRRL